ATTAIAARSSSARCGCTSSCDRVFRASATRHVSFRAMLAGSCWIATMSLVFGCVTHTQVENAVLAYDAGMRRAISRLLLLNIPRARHNQPMHFTAIANVVATYRYSFSGGVVPAQTGDLGYLPMPTLNGAIEENPTLSISPMQGEEFTQRL